MSELKSVVFMDYENIYWSMKRQYNYVPEPGRLIESLRELSGKYGTVCLMQAYADFDNPEFHGLLSELQRRSVEPRHVFSKNYDDGTRKNAADIEMSLDALELMYNRDDVDVFVLVCGDRDMIQVIRKLRARGKQVYVVAVEKAMSKDLIGFANGFSTVELLLGVTPAAPVGLEAMIRRLHTMEASMPFVGLKYFMKVLSGGEHSDQRIYDLVNKAIADDILRTYQVPNPYDERFPTTACRLNFEHEGVKRALGPDAPATPAAPGAAAAAPTTGAEPAAAANPLAGAGRRPGAIVAGGAAGTGAVATGPVAGSAVVGGAVVGGAADAPSPDPIEVIRVTSAPAAAAAAQPVLADLTIGEKGQAS